MHQAWGGVRWGEEGEVDDRSPKSTADMTLSPKDPPLEKKKKKKKSPGNCEDFYQWERADEVAGYQIGQT